MGASGEIEFVPGAGPAIPPLTRNGYQRRPETEVDIRALLGLRGAALLDGFRESRPEAAGYRKTEALIFFLRRALVEEDDRTVRGLFRILYDRCRQLLRNQIRGFNDDMREEILARFYEKLTELLLRDDDICDFMQHSFGRVLRLRTLSVIEQVVAEQQRLPLIDDLRAESGEQDERSRIDTIADGGLSAEQHMLIRDSLARLPEDMRELVILRYLDGWRVGDDRGTAGEAAGEPTLAELYRITPRAVRKRLAKADALLEQYRKDSE